MRSSILLTLALLAACYREHGLGAERCAALPEAQPVTFVSFASERVRSRPVERVVTSPA